MNGSSGAFADHLKEAIVVNLERKKFYAEKTANRSLFLSWALIASEKMAMAFAWVIDRKAQKFQREGIPIIANDFVPMEPLPSSDSPPLYQGMASRALFKKMGKDLLGYRRSIRALVTQGLFLEGAIKSYELLQAIRKLEEEHQCHFSMTCHLLESIGFALLHAPEYAAKSRGATTALSKLFVRVQLLGLLTGLFFDKKAQPLHQMGVGILFNDVPEIPFVKEYLKNLS